MNTTQKVLAGTAVVASGVGGYYLYTRLKAGSSTSLPPVTGTNPAACVEAYVGGANPTPGYSGFCTYPAIVQEAAKLGTAMVTRRCGYFWVMVGQSSVKGNSVNDVAEYYGGAAGGAAPTLIRVYPQSSAYPVGSWFGGYTC